MGNFYPTSPRLLHAIEVAGVTSRSRDNRSRRLSRRLLLRLNSSLMEESRDSSPRRGEEVVSRHSDDDRFVCVPVNVIN